MSHGIARRAIVALWKVQFNKQEGVSMVAQLIRMIRSVWPKMPKWLAKGIDEVEELIPVPAPAPVPVPVDNDPPLIFQTCTAQKADGTPCRAIPHKESGRCRWHPLPTAGANIGNF